MKKYLQCLLITVFLFSLLFSFYMVTWTQPPTWNTQTADSARGVIAHTSLALNNNLKFTLIASSPSPSTSPTPLVYYDYMVSASAGPGGTISPSGDMFTTPGESHSFTITPNAGYQILDVVVDGESKGAIATYELPDIHSNHQIAASFTPSPTPTPTLTTIITITAIVIAIAAIAAALILYKRKNK